MSALSRIRATAAEEAAAWKDRLATDGSEECRAEFRSWFKRSAINQDQYLILSGFRRRLGSVPPSLFSEVRETAVWSRLAGVAVAVGLLVAGGAWLLRGRTSKTIETTFTAPKDASEEIHLNDGSTLHLNGGWARMLMSPGSRDLLLYDGEAKVSVSRDPARPFRLINGPFVMDDVGTEFVATPKGKGIGVLVIHGSVRLTVNCRTVGPFARKTQMLLRQQQEVELEDDRCTGVSAQRTLDQHGIDQKIAWTVGWLHFHDDRLAEAAERFNRYNAIQIRVDPTIADLRISGDFAATNPAAFAHTAEALLGVRITPVATDSVKTDVLYLVDSHSKSGGRN